MENKTVNIDIDKVYKFLPDYPEDDSNLLTVEEFASLIEEHPRTVYRCIKSGKVPNKYNIFFKALPYYTVFKKKHNGLKGKRIVRFLAKNLRDDMKDEIYKIIHKRSLRGNNRVKLVCNVSLYIKEKLKYLATIEGTTINDMVTKTIEEHIKQRDNNLSR